MMRLIGFELAKVWRKKQLLVLLLAILAANLLLHWYGNRATEFQPDLAAYKKAAGLLAPMTEEEKAAWLQKRTEDLKDPQAELLFADTLDQEAVLTEELYKEAEAVTHYREYLQDMQENQKELSGISIFAKKTPSGGEAEEAEETDSFSWRNIQKSREDYRSRTTDNVKWIPSKGPVSSMDSTVTGILCFVAVFLFAVWGIIEEKEKKLFFITRVTDRGLLPDSMAGMAALGISCVFFCLLLYGGNWLFYGIHAGFWDLSWDVQSVYEYMESCYSITLGQYMILSVLTKAAAAFCFGLLLQFTAVMCRRKLVPFIAGIVLLAGNTLLYEFLPPVGGLSVLKYLNLAGVFHTENLYGDYLNFNIAGFPVSRTGLSLLLILILLFSGCVLTAAAFCRGDHFCFMDRSPGREKQKSCLRKCALRERTVHTSLFLHECYKLFFTNRGLLILFVCLLVTGRYYVLQDYRLSVREQYYKELMMQLEGELTDKKEEIILTEKKRYEEAYEELERISRLEGEGKLGRMQAEEQREQWNAVVVFYPAFQRAWQQYERIRESGGIFIYDTGWLYLFGAWGEGFLTELLVFVIGILLMFSNSAAMEFQNKTDLLICSSDSGMHRVFGKKACLCVMTGAVLPFCMRIFHLVLLQKTFPVHYWGSSIQGIARYQDLPVSVPVWLFAVAVLGIQIFVCSLIALCILFLSYWRKNFVQTVLVGALIFVVPPALYAQGIGFMKYLTVYPVYSADIF